MKADIDLIGKRYQSWVENSCGLGISGVCINEIVHHIHWAKQKISTFEGREHLVDRCMDKLFAGHRDGGNGEGGDDGDFDGGICPHFKGISLYIMGVSGSGKTALASIVSQKIKERLGECSDDLPLIIRFCGTSTESSNGFALVRSICLQINFLYFG